MTISAFSDELAQVRTKKKEFLSQIERIVPWGEWLAMIQPCYYKGERGNKPYPLEIMLRLYLLQNLYDLSDEAAVAEAIDSRAFSDFCGVDSSNQVPDGDTLGRFRNLLIRNGLQEKLFAQVVAALMERGLILKKGTIVDSTIISAPSSTKNKEKKRDPDANQVKKGSTWHFGYKAHIGVDKDSGLVHTVEATAANVHDVAEVPKLLTGEEEAVYGDSGWSAFKFKKHCLLKMEECWTEQEAPRLPCVGQKGLHRKTIPPRKKKPTVGQCEGRVAKQRKRLDQKNRISEIKEAHLVTIRLA